MLANQLPAGVALAIFAAGVFLLAGLFTGIWKYVEMMRNESARAHYYVDIAHRSSLLYANCSLILAVLAYFSTWSEGINFWAVLLNVIYFAMAIILYVVHGILKDTNNQLRKPHRLGPLTLASIFPHLAVSTLIVAEVGGTLVLLVGTFSPLWSAMAA
ncbi:MAG: hypothetical protein REI12_13445 [Pedobacter sp.]|nr:hypothetical protein [Pedobacter sp.]